MADAAPFRVFIGLIVVIAAILLCGWIARRAGLAGRTHGGALRIVDSLNLGPRQRIVLVQVEDARLVVGIAANQMNLLHTLPPGSAAPEEPGLPASRAFAHKLGQALRRN
ncbi:flagellar biosynthetic protein FliO [Bordetella genomosp. 9]|uniref:Flagellar protein n=1 Tax=Bordetella genomosp. 9 TaxID=1416803 RepID=A0A1W6Z0Q7_9BORD|nr:flagellar biosynthetic protein FliO [Bordetella genomosp. 9]ARP86935.1 flagellar biosynthetic protein FliO [Bordetella genomosp. 9]ARP90920.1 flagellar biosynthetic protein FliO [Bordetella genomosp. 9]